MATNVQAVKKLNQAKAQRQAQLAQAYEDLGGSNPAYKPIQSNNVLAQPQRMTATIPQLEKAVVNAYENPVNTGAKTTDHQPGRMVQGRLPANENRTSWQQEQNRINLQQQFAPLYNDIKNRQTEVALAGKDIAPIASMPTIMGMGNGAYGAVAGVDREDAQRYFDTQNAVKKEANARQFANAHPLLASGAAVISRPIETAEGVLQNVGQRMSGTPLTNTYNPSSIIREEVANNINISDKEIPEWAQKGPLRDATYSDLGRIGYSAANSVGDMALAGYLGGAGGYSRQAAAAISAAIMGTEKAADVMNDAITRGLTPDQIVAEGMLSGASTAITERLPFDNLWRGGSIIKNIVSEGGQEIAEDIADTLFDEIVTRLGRNNDKSSLHNDYQQYVNAGYTPDEAYDAVAQAYFNQLVLDGVIGGITGGLTQGGANVAQGRNFFSGNLNQRSQNQILDSLKPMGENVTAENYNDYVKTIDQLKKNTPGMEKALDRLVSDTSKQIVSDIKSAGDMILANPDMDSYNTFVQNAEQIKSQIPTLTKEIDNEIARVSGQLSVLNSIDSEANVNSNVDNINENVDIPAVEQTQIPVQNEIPVIPREPRARRSDVSAAINAANGIRENLGLFKEKNARTLEKRIDKAIQNVRTTTGQAQIDAIQELNNTLDGVRNVMQYSTIGIDERGFNSDGFERMHNVTDGRRIKVSPSLLRDLNISLTQLDNMTNTGTKNRIRFYAENNPNAVSLDSVWNEMVEMSGNELPMVSEGDQLSALIDYINEYKSKKGNEVNTVSFNDLPVTDSRSEVVKEWESKADNLIDRMLEGDYTEDEVKSFLNDILEAGNQIKKNPEAQQNLADLWTAVKYAERVKPQSTIKLDEDVKAIQTPEEAMQRLEEAVDGLAMDLGFFGGETNEESEAEPVQRGRVKTGRFRNSDVFTNTAEKSGILSDKQRAMHNADGSMLMESNSEEESVAEANKRIKENGYQNEYEELIKKSDFDNVDTDELMMIWKHYNDQAIALDERGIDSTSTWQKAYECLRKIKEEGSREGSALQALAKWSRNNTPEGLLAQAESIITAAQNGYSGYSKTDQGWFKQIAKETKGKTKEMDVDFIKGFITEARKLEGLDINSQQAKHIMANLGKMVNSQIPVTLREKVTTILMDNMLGNFRTLITRNAGGNIAFNAIEQKLRKPLSALIDSQLSKARGTERTISKNTDEGRSAYREGFKEAIKQEIYDFANNIQSARSGENNLTTAVTNNRQVFKNSNIFGKIGNFYNKLVKAGLSAGDRPFYESVYNQYMTEYKKMYDEGKLGDMSEAEFKKAAEANAQLKALEAVYQDDSKMATAFMKMKEGVNDLSQGIIGADILSQFTMPFVKTPANIIQRAIEYSPIGIVKNAIQTVKEVNHAMTNNGMMDFNQERFATETARNLIGSVLFTAAVMLAKSGAMTGAYSEDKDMAQAQREAGMQEYALHNPLGFNGDVSVDWIPVLGNDMVAAASAYDAFRNNPELNAAQRIGKGLTAGLKSQFESSMLQGLQRLVGGSGAFGNGEGDILTNAVDTLKSGATQFIPSLLRQGAAVGDPYRRQLSGANPDDYYVNSVLNSIPGLRESLEPRISRTGENIEQNAGRSFGWKVFDNFINPATVTVGTPDNVRDEAMRLFESTNSNRAFEPTVTIGELKVDDHVPTAEEYTEYQRNAYGAMNEVASQVIDSEYYSGLSDDDKVSMLADIYSAIKTVEKKNVLDLDTSGLTGAEKAYYEGGTDGLIDYMTVRSVLSQMGMQNNATNREQVMQTLNQGGVEAVNQMVEQAHELEEAGLNTNMQFKYEHATNYIPSLTPTQFADTWNQINTDGNTNIKQDEIIAFLNQNPQSHANDAMQYWQAYGNSSWSSIPVLSENGVWEAKRQ